MKHASCNNENHGECFANDQKAEMINEVTEAMVRVWEIRQDVICLIFA
jgi:phenylpyruvate tautomerase PptA (4-oxalocrotonate tautomerase family)